MSTDSGDKLSGQTQGKNTGDRLRGQTQGTDSAPVCLLEDKLSGQTQGTNSRDRLRDKLRGQTQTVVLSLEDLLGVAGNIVVSAEAESEVALQQFYIYRVVISEVTLQQY